MPKFSNDVEVIRPALLHPASEVSMSSELAAALYLAISCGQLRDELKTRLFIQTTDDSSENIKYWRLRSFSDQNDRPSWRGWNAWHSSSETQHFSCQSLSCCRTEPITRWMLSILSTSHRPVSSFSWHHPHTHKLSDWKIQNIGWQDGSWTILNSKLTMLELLNTY